MPTDWVSDGQFWKRHADWHRSGEAKAMKKRLLRRQSGLCARCGKPLPSWGGVLNLTSYEGMKRGRVDDSDANLLHRKCHPKGTYGWDKLRSDRKADRWINALGKALSWSWRAVRWLLLLPWRLARRR